MARQAKGMRKRKDGLWEYRFTIGKDDRRSVYGSTQQICYEKELEVRRQLAEGVRIGGGNITVDRYFDIWLDAKQDTVKESTIRTNRVLYATISKAMIGTSKFGSIKVKDVEVQDVRELQKVLLESHSSRTVNDQIALLRSMFKSAITVDRIITFNPASAVRSIKRTEIPARDSIHRSLTREETVKFLDASRDSYYHNLYSFLLNTGCRIGEAGALQIRDIGKNSIHVARTITRAENGGYRIGDDTKTASGNRLIPLNAETVKALESQRTFNRLVFGEEQTMMDTIFRSMRGSILKSSLVNDDIKAICDKAGIEYFSVHALRHTFCTRCAESGMDVKTLQTIMGHSNIAMTMDVYTHCEQRTVETQLKAVSFV